MIDPDELRFIAEEAKLSVQQQDLLRQAATYLEDICKQLVQTNLNLIEEQAHRIALNDRMIEMQKTWIPVSATWLPNK